MSGYKLELNKRLAFRCLFVLLMALVFVRYAFSIDFPTVILLGIVTAMILLGDRNEIIGACICCIPMTQAFLHTYALLIAVAVFAFKYRAELRIGLAILPVLMLVLWELLHGYSGAFSIVSFVGDFSPFLLCAVLMWQDGRKVDYPFQVRVLALCTCWMCVTLLGSLLVRSGFSLVGAFANMQRLGSGDETSGVSLMINPNSLGVICVLAMSGLLQLMTTGRKKPGDLPMLVLMLICGTLTTSRTYLVLLVTMLMLFWVGQKGSFSQKFRFLLAVLLSVALALGVLMLVFPDVVQAFVKRFLVEDITTGRSRLFTGYHRFWISSPAYMGFGLGLDGFGKKAMSQAMLPNVPHNGIQEVLLAWGIPGLLMFGLFLLTLIWRGREEAGSHRLLNYIPLVLLLAKAQVGQMLTSDYTMLALAFCYLSLAYDFRKNREIRD